jgi:hypothetical protein
MVHASGGIARNQLYIRYEETQAGPKGEQVSVRTIEGFSSELKLIRHSVSSRSSPLFRTTCKDSTAHLYI